ncbi:MAG TPA: hydrogenase nickel incorporation protein HypB [Anaerolineae bacterium]|nr:hydrogenase nickel incorporation protein HypB [Anaerolineae bacterium]
MTQRISIVENILNANDRLADENRSRLDEFDVFALNLMASPGAGKTTLIEQTLSLLPKQHHVAVVDGDVATSIDADRAAKAGAVAAIQINTGGGCHLDAVMFNQALDKLDLNQVDILLVENVGNLICPSGFKLGTHKSILIASVPEGDDKPYKYPGMYRGVDALVINKIDLLPYVPFDMDYFKKGVEILNPGLVIFPLSCQTGQGIDKWIDWLSKALIDIHNSQ